MSERARALEQALRELTAMVRGECPSLLNEDSGGNGDLSYQIDKLLAVDPPPSGASSVDAPIYRQVYIVTHYPEGGLRGVHASQAGAEAEIAELCREYPDYTRQDFSIVCDRIRPSPPSGASPQAETSEDEDDAPAVDSWSAPLRKPVVPKILSTDDFYALLRIIEVLPVADPFLTDLQSKLSAEERRQHGNRASHLSGPEFVREIERIEALIQSRLPAPVSPVEPTPPKCDECGLELGIKALFDGRATAGCGACAERKAYDPMAYTPDSVEPTPEPPKWRYVGGGVFRSTCEEPETCEWRDISTAPKDETPIRLKWAGTTVEAIGRWCPAQVLPSGFGRPNYSDDWRDVEGNDVLLMPTHWKPVSLDDSDEWKPLPAPVSPVEPEPPTNPPCARCGHALSAHRPEFGACDGRDRPCACPEYQVPTAVEAERAKACHLCGALHLCGAPMKVEREP